MAWFVSPAAEALRAKLNELYPNRDKTTDGAIGDAAHNARPSDHNPDYKDGGIVRARDFDKDLFGVGDERNVAEAQRIVDLITRDPRTAYVIYRGRIWYNPAVFAKSGWQPYTAEGKAGWFNPHKEHFHVSIRRGITWDHDTRDWNIGDEMVTNEDIKKIAAETANAVLNYPHPKLGGLTIIEAIEKIRPDIDTVHNAVKAVPNEVLGAKIPRVGKLGSTIKGDTSLRAVVANYDDHVMRSEVAIEELKPEVK